MRVNVQVEIFYLKHLRLVVYSSSYSLKSVNYAVTLLSS